MGAPTQCPGERPARPSPTYLVHAHAGINPIGQVSTFGFASRVHAEPSCPEASTGGTGGHRARAQSPLPGQGPQEAAGAPGNSPWDAPSHIPGPEVAPARHPAGRGHGAASGSLWADPDCSEHTPRLRGSVPGAGAEAKSAHPLIREAAAGRAERQGDLACSLQSGEQRDRAPSGWWWHWMHPTPGYVSAPLSGREKLIHRDPRNSWKALLGVLLSAAWAEAGPALLCVRSSSSQAASLHPENAGMQRAGQPTAQALS